MSRSHTTAQTAIMANTNGHRWMLISDLHFHKDNLERNRETMNWIVSRFNEVRPSTVFVLGDTIHTRGYVHLKTYHEIAKLFGAFHNAEWRPAVHVLIGNHDMLDKHSRTINGMETFSIATSSRFTVYSEIRRVVIEGMYCIFLPFHDDQSVIAKFLSSISSTERAKTIIFAHVALDGAIVNGVSDYSNSLCKGSGLTVRHFEGFLQTFLGHFHHHRSYGEKRNVTYVGAPMQFNFGDAGDVERGLVLYDPVKNRHELCVSPYAEHFVRISWDVARRLSDSPTEGNVFSDKFVQIRIPASAVADGSWNIELETKIRKNLRTAWNVARIDVSHEQQVALPRCESSDPVHSSENGRVYALAVADEYVKIQLSADDDVQQKRQEYIQSVIGRHYEGSFEATGKLFTADIVSLAMENFMGVKGSLEIRFDHLEPGVWLIRGRNGAGKSTFLEAIAWCLYGETFRQCNANEVVNLSAEKSKRECSVTLEFSNGCIVKRSRKAGKPSLSFVRSDGDVAERGVVNVGQMELEALLNVGWKKFARSVMLSSSATLNFTTSKETEKRAVIEHLLGFEIFARFAAFTDADMKDKRTELDDMALRIARVEEQLKAHSARVEEQTDRKRDLESQVESGKSANAYLEVEANSIERSISELDEQISRRRIEKEKLTNSLEMLARRMVECRANYAEGLDLLRTKVELEKEGRREKVKLALKKNTEQLAELQVKGSEVQQVIDTLFSNYTRRLAEIDDEARTVHRLVLRRRQADIHAANLRNATDKLAGLQQTLQSVEGVLENNELSIIEKAATHVARSLISKNSTGFLDTDIMAIDCEVIRPLRSVVRDTCRDNNDKRDALVAAIKVLREEVDICHCRLDELGPSDPTLDERYTAATERSRDFHDVDPSGHASWVAANALKTDLEITRRKVENMLHVLASDKSSETETDCDESLQHIPTEIARIQTEIDEIHHMLQSEHTREHANDESLRTAHSRKSSINVRIKQNEAVNDQLQLQISTVASNITRIVRARSETQANLDSLVNNRKLAELDRAVIGFWKDALRSTKASGFRAFCIDRKIHEINQLIDSNIRIIGDDGDGLFVDLGCKLTSALTLVEKDNAISFKRRSDGQKKRGELALFFAIVQKSKEEGGFYPKFMFMDEVYDALDVKGQLAVHRWIEYNNATDRGEKTFVITHSTAIETTHRAKVNGIITAKWTERGSSYEIENNIPLSRLVFPSVV